MAKQQKSSKTRTYRETLQPLFKAKEYGLVSDLIVRNPEIKDYLSKEQLRVMMDYYETGIYSIGKVLDLVNDRLVVFNNEVAAVKNNLERVLHDTKPKKK